MTGVHGFSIKQNRVENWSTAEIGGFPLLADAPKQNRVENDKEIQGRRFSGACGVDPGSDNQALGTE